jgi:GT2 family glycosyltransferase
LKTELQNISIVIPSYRREQVLLDSISALLELEYTATEILVVDQTEQHEAKTIEQLEIWQIADQIRWIKQKKPSITGAMNHGLCKARSPLVLFLDDDITPHPKLVLNHVRAHNFDCELWATVGQVIQPWQEAEELDPPRKMNGLQKDFDFPFNSTRDAEVQNVMAGNLCVNRERALSIGGFDENFVGAAYRFETDFARRVINAGGKILFVGSAGIDHLRVKTGGTRSEGNHMASASPLHGFGDYYYAFKQGSSVEAWKYSLQRLLREVRTRFHLTHPWWIPVKVVGEIRACILGKATAKAIARRNRET